MEQSQWQLLLVWMNLTFSGQGLLLDRVVIFGWVRPTPDVAKNERSLSLMNALLSQEWWASYTPCTAAYKLVQWTKK